MSNDNDFESTWMEGETVQKTEEADRLIGEREKKLAEQSEEFAAEFNANPAAAVQEAA